MDNTDRLLMLKSKVRDDHGTLLQAVSDLHLEINRRASKKCNFGFIMCFFYRRIFKMYAVISLSSCKVVIYYLRYQ